jgi:cell division transport system ATP-binding protein
MRLNFKGVTKSFGPITAIEDITFKIKPKEFLFITGRSGAGKSTILKLIRGEYFADEGKVKVDDLTLDKKTNRKKIIKLRRKIGMVYQDYRLLNRQTVGENILIALDIIGVKKEKRSKKLHQVIEKVGLENRLNMFPSQLSGGELQRVCLARALIKEPELLMADEPTGNLDPETSWEIMNLMKEINENSGTTVIMATHDFDIVNSSGKRVIKIEGGKLAYDKEKGQYE